jgi:hypothetical protein
MIRDFFDHLLWELRINHDELQAAQHGGQPINPELVDQLEKYIKKRSTSSLLASLFMQDREGATSEEIERNQRACAAAKLRIREEQLAHMEALRALFSEAIECASHPNDIGVLRIKGPEDIEAMYRTGD